MWYGIAFFQIFLWGESQFSNQQEQDELPFATWFGGVNKYLAFFTMQSDGKTPY